MKITSLSLIFLLTALDLWAQSPPPGTIKHPPSANRVTQLTNNAAATGVPNLPVPTGPAPAGPGSAGAPFTPTGPMTGSPSTVPGATPAATEPPEETIPAGNINFQGVDVSEVLLVYSRLVGRTLLRAGLPNAPIILKTETPLTKTEAIQALQAVLALNGIAVINVGEKFVKVVPSAEANTAGAAFNNVDATNLPNMGSYITHIVQLKYVKPSEVVPAITPFAKLNSIVPLDSNGIIIVRDYAENVKRMLEMIAQIDVNVPAVYISEVIPIKYALAGDIATALNSLGGSGGNTVSIGSSAAGGGGGGNGLRSPGGSMGLQGGNNVGGVNGLNSGQQQRGIGTTPNGTPSSGNSFQDRLRSIVQRAAGGGGNKEDQIQIFGQTKIIADERSNSLLVFATRQDMDSITNIIGKLDVLLSQVLIESVIMEVSLGNSWNFGVSAAQRPQQLGDSSVVGGGIMNNGNSSFLNVLKNVATNGATSLTGSFPSNNASGLNYFANINQNFDIAVQAAASDNSVTIIQKPRIQTFQAQPASFFVGSTVPYITGSTYGSAYGNSSSYSQLSVGVSLQVTPFINPDGLVVMQLDEEIDDISGYTTIDGNPVPNTAKKTLSSNVAVKDRDSIILGGLIYSSKSKSKSGVPILQDIPLLGALFSSRSSDKSRQELLVLMRPTVLKTPELAALQADVEKSRLPGIAHAEAQNDADELKQVQAEERAHQLQVQRDAKAAAKQAARDQKLGIYVSTNTPPSQTSSPQTND